MDGTAAIEANRAALIRIVAMLVEMAGLADDAPPTSPLMGEVATQSREGVSSRSQPPPDASRRPPHKGEVERPTIPRILWRAILALLRPAESAARRLIIAASRGLTVPPPRLRPPKPATMEPLLRRFGIAVMMTRDGRDGISSPAKRGRGTTQSVGEGALAQGADERGEPTQPRIPAFPLFDPPRRLDLHGARRPTIPPHAAPRIFVPGLTEPAPLPPPPSCDDLVSATRLTQRLAALAAALDDLPGQARRFARWQAARAAAGARHPAAPRRILPIRRVPPGGRLFRYDPSAAHPPNVREIDEILAHAHSLALHALESPDTS